MVAAVDTGFNKAWWTIVDTHVTTIVSCAFLFLFGEGPVKGFAVTLTIGLIANVFTAVFVSRTIFDYELSGQPQHGGAKHLVPQRTAAARGSAIARAAGRMWSVTAGNKIEKAGVQAVCEAPAWQDSSMELFKNTNYDFLGKKWPFIIASLVLTVAGFISIAVQGGLEVWDRLQRRRSHDGEVRLGAAAATRSGRRCRIRRRSRAKSACRT